MAHAAQIADVRRTPVAVRISRLDAAIFYAEVVLDDGAAVDARPRDALVIAVAAGLPIEVAPDVIAATRNPRSDHFTEDLEQSTPNGAEPLAEEVRSQIAANEAEVRQFLAGD